MIGVMTQPGRSVVPEVWEGTLAGRLPYIAFGAGPPLIVFRELGFSNTNPTGFQRCLDPEVRLRSPLARGGFTVYAVNRPPGLGVGTTTTADLATDHARGLEAEFGKPVDILGISKEVLFAYTEAL
jgi:hypothetical protein